MKTNDQDQRINADGTSGQNTAEKAGQDVRPFRSHFGWLIKVVNLTTVYTMLWQSVYAAGGFDVSFSAVNETKANARSGFFNPSEVKENSEKKSLLIQQRNALAKNLNEFNRKQADIHRETREIGRDVTRNMQEEQREREQMIREVMQSAQEAAQLAGKYAFYYTMGKAKTVSLPSGQEMTFHKYTYFKGGQVVGTFGDVVEGRDGTCNAPH